MIFLKVFFFLNYTHLYRTRIISTVLGTHKTSGYIFIFSVVKFSFALFPYNMKSNKSKHHRVEKYELFCYEYILKFISKNHYNVFISIMRVHIPVKLTSRRVYSF